LGRVHVVWWGGARAGKAEGEGSMLKECDSMDALNPAALDGFKRSQVASLICSWYLAKVRSKICSYVCMYVLHYTANFSEFAIVHYRELQK
jgi:hypothetical protein